MQELGADVKLEVLTDSAAARGAIQRSGTGRMKHIALSRLWVQEKARNGEIRYRKINRGKIMWRTL